MSADEDDALMWLAFAIGDLDAVQGDVGRHLLPRHAANLAQQAVEKALKAALVLSGIDPPRTHDVDELRGRLPRTWRVTRRFPTLGHLTDYAADTRYPDNVVAVRPIMAATAVRQASAVVRLIREDFEKHGVSTASVRAR